MTVKFFYGWLIALCCTLITMINGGIFFTFSVFFKPVAIDLDWSRSETAMNYSAMLIAYAPAAFFAGRLADRQGPRKILIFAALLIGIGFFGCTQATNLIFMIMSYAIIGLGLGTTLALPTATIQHWFVKWRAIMVGVVYAGNSMGGLIFAPLINYLITFHGWRTAYLIIGIIYSSVIAISASFLVSNPSMKKLSPLGYKEQEPNSYYHTQCTSKLPDSISQAFRIGSFWSMAVLFILTLLSSSFIISHLVPYITDKGISAAVGAQGLGQMVGISVIGRLIMSWVAGKIGWMKTLTISYFVASASIVWLIFVTGKESFYLFIIIYGLSWGSTLALLGGAVGSLFGLSMLSELLGFLLGLGVLVGALTPWLGGLIFDLTASYTIATIITAVLFAIAGLLSLLIRPPE